MEMCWRPIRNTPDIDPDGDSLTVSEVNGIAADVGNQITLESGALLRANANGTFDYDPNGQFESLAEGETALDTFSYTVSDGNGGSDTATVGVTITGVNGRPLAVDDEVSTDNNSSLNGDVLAANPNAPDIDPDGDPLTVSEVNGVVADVGNQIMLASGALLTVNTDGAFDYDPNGQFASLAVGETALDTFSYTVSDGNGASDTATVTVTITGSSGTVEARVNASSDDAEERDSGSILPGQSRFGTGTRCRWLSDRRDAVQRAEHSSKGDHHQCLCAVPGG